MIVDIMTVEEAATFAKVNRTSIYQHINKSRKLTRYTVGGRVYVSRIELEDLYPAVDDGVKQKNTVKPKGWFDEFFQLRAELDELKAKIDN